MIITGIGVLCHADTSPVLHMNMENKAQEMRKRWIIRRMIGWEFFPFLWQYELKDSMVNG